MISLFRLCCRYRLWRTLSSPLVWICMVYICVLYSFFGSQAPDVSSYWKAAKYQELRITKGDVQDRGSPGHDAYKEGLPMSGHVPSRKQNGVHRPRHGKNVNDTLDSYGEISSALSSKEYDYSQLLAKELCRLDSRKDLNNKFKERCGEVDLRTVEVEVLGQKRNSAVLYVERMRAILGTIRRFPSSRYINHDGYRRENERGIVVGDHMYYAGGHWRPLHCEPRWRVAIVVPFRKRHAHLTVLLRNLIPLLKLQKLEFRIFVTEQDNDFIFNRGLLKNIGYLEATRFGWWDCVVFHDIDQIPMRGANYYGCDGMPRHFCARPEEMGFKPAYDLLFGGVVGVTANQMEKSNGYSNFYWGWGGEDDDLLKRLHVSGYSPTRDLKEGFYRTLNHTKKSKKDICAEAFCLLRLYYERMSWDGIKQIPYNSDRLQLSLLYTHLSVDIRKEPWNSGFEPCHENDK